MVALFPSLISADLLKLEHEVKTLEAYCSGFHLDVMDFHFVPNLTWGTQFINAIRQATDKQLHIHLMVEYPEKYIDRMDLKEQDIVFIHIESPTNLSITQLLGKITAMGAQPGIAINPFTPLEAIITLPYRLDNVLVMSVNPGFSGQKFMPHSINRIKALSDFRKAHDLNFKIAVDGGVNHTNIKKIVDSGADSVAVASAIFEHKDRVKAIQELLKLS